MHQFTMRPSVGDYTLLKPAQCQDVSTQIYLHMTHTVAFVHVGLTHQGTRTTMNSINSDG